MSAVRFQLLFGPASTRPYRMGRPQTDPLPQDDRSGGKPQPNGAKTILAPVVVLAAGEPTDWYGWRLMGANNREMGRSARSFISYPQTRWAVRQLQKHADRLVRCSLVDPATGRWGWRLDLDNAAVAVSSRWYERDHDSRLGMAKFVALVPQAALSDGVVTLYVRRGSMS
jgi:hypothetical protein